MNRQNDTRIGLFLATVAVATLVGKEGTLARLTSTGLQAPSAASDFCPFLILEGAAVGEDASVLPLSPDGNVRIRLNGTCNKGDRLVLSTGGDAGKVEALAAQTGRLFVVGIAEEAGVDEQMLLVRPFPQYLDTGSTPTAFSAAAPAATAATNSSPYGFSQVQANALLSTVNDMRTALIAKGIMAANA